MSELYVRGSVARLLYLGKGSSVYFAISAFALYFSGS